MDLPEAPSRDLVAIKGGHPGQVRRVTQGRLDAQDVVDGVRSLLQDHGIRVKKPRITQCVQGDILGDGEAVWLACASSRPDLARTGTLRAGDYSLAAVIYIWPRGTRRASALEVRPFELMTAANSKGRLGQLFHIVSALDVDGNVCMEVAVASESHEGRGMGLYSFDGSRVRKLLEAGWKL